jgi:hypothetical protein
MSSQRVAPDFQKQIAAISAATIDKYEIASGLIPWRTQNCVAKPAVCRNTDAIGRREVGS